MEDRKKNIILVILLYFRLHISAMFTIILFCIYMHIFILLQRVTCKHCWTIFHIMIHVYICIYMHFVNLFYLSRVFAFKAPRLINSQLGLPVPIYLTEERKMRRSATISVTMSNVTIVTITLTRCRGAPLFWWNGTFSSERATVPSGD